MGQGAGREQKSVPSSKTRQADRETSTELNKRGIQREILFQTVRNENGDHKTVNTDDTSHDNGDDVYRLALASVFRGLVVEIEGNCTFNNQIWS